MVTPFLQLSMKYRRKRSKSSGDTLCSDDKMIQMCFCLHEDEMLVYTGGGEVPKAKNLDVDRTELEPLNSFSLHVAFEGRKWPNWC